MKKKLLTLLGLAFGLTASAQLVNNGGTITVQQGATLKVESDITNNTGSIITNSGIIEVEGNFDNSGTLTSNTSMAEIKFTGSGESQFTGGTHAVGDLTIAKTSGGTVRLMDDITITDDILFQNDNNQIVVDGGHLTIIKIAQLTGSDPMSTDDNEFIVTNGTGGVTAPGLGAAAYTFPVGFAAGQYNPVTITESGAADEYTVRALENALDAGPTGNPVDNAATASWEITEATTGGSSLTVKAAWNGTGDEPASFDRTNSAVLMWDGTEYSTAGVTFGAATDETGGEFSQTRTGFVGFSDSKVFIVGDDGFRDAIMLDLKAFLSGPYASGMMTDGLRTAGLIPATEPYDALTGFTHVNGNPGASSSNFDNTADGDDIVDWVFIEVRDGATPATVVQTKSALIQRDGDIVDLDGSSDV